MLDVIKGFFNNLVAQHDDPENQRSAEEIRVATCALFLEMAHIDETFSKAEVETILAILKDRFGLTGEQAEALMAEAEAELEESVDLWQFAHLINAHYSNAEKLSIIETLWQIVFVDGKMDKYENYLMHKVANLLRFSHSQLMDAKIKVKRATLKTHRSN